MLYFKGVHQRGKLLSIALQGHPTSIFGKNMFEDDLRSSRIFGTFVLKFLACLPVLGFSNI